MVKVIKDEKKIDEVLSRGVTEVIIKSNLKKKLLSGKKLRVKLGIDPTGSFLHLGHAVVLKKLRDFQRLGHQVIFLIGDFTAKIGDPTGRTSGRKPMTEQEIKANMKNYQVQAGKILDMTKVEVRYNSEWLAKLDLKDTIILTSKITYAQMAQRASFKERIKKDVDLSIQEFLYPAMQGYDSVALKADVELGGTDQKFNLLMGRQLQKRYDQEPQEVVTCPLLEGLDGVEKMSKSIGNYIGLTENPDSMFGKVMSIPDRLIVRYFDLCTEVSKEELVKIKNDLKKKNINPRDVKIRLAKEIVSVYHSNKKAILAQENFEKVFSRKETPDEVTEVRVKKGENILDLLVGSGLAESRGDAKRKMNQGGVKIDDKVIKDLGLKLDENFVGRVLKVGKREFRKISFK